MSSNLANIKNAILTDLNALVSDQVLAYVQEVDLRKDPLAGDIPYYPAAFLMPPATDSDVADNRTLLRTYTFDILIAVKAEDFVSSTDLEDLINQILDRFDNDPTLDGSADGAVLPSTSTPEPVQTGERDLIVFFVKLRCNRTVSLTF